ncbi:transcriptional regulator ATRX homolog isoform X3 [Littorina saxatilis]|uniref:transcriptional regulator ATRX homolog isoform X3 n=1 Tax=Littorina saxatilis TaxID=31220 RepID=UPI0038B5AC21
MEGGAVGSSRRKAMPLKVRLSFGSNSKGSEKVNGNKEKEKDVDNLSESQSDADDEDIPELPEGTVVVNPEPVEEKTIRFRGPEFKPANKKGGNGGGGGASSSSAAVLEKLLCTACGRQVNPWKTGMVKKHKDLKVLVCRKCYNFLGSGEIAQDEDGMDEQCRWCGEGGRLTICDKCPRAYCKGCIMRNFGRAAFTAVTESENWECYSCDPKPLDEHRKQCRTVVDAIKAADGKKSSKSSQPSSASTPNSSKSSAVPSSSSRSSSKSQSELVDDPASVVSKLVSSVDVDEDNIVPVTKDLLMAVTSLRSMLLSIQQAVDSDNEIVTDDKEEVAPLFSFSRDVSLRRKKEHCAKALKKTLQTFLPSTLTILRKKKTGSSGTSKSNAFAKSLSSLAASKCNGDVKNSDSPKSSGSRTSAQSSSASTSRSSVKSTPASSSKTSLNSPHVSISKTTNVRTEVSEKSGEKKPQDKKVTEKRALEKKEEEKKETKGGGDKKREKKDTAERKSQEVQEKGDKSKESPENRLDNKKEDTREVSRKRKEQSQETEEKKNEEKAKKKEVVGRKTDKKEEETEKKESRAKKTGKSTASKEKDQQSSDEERSSAIAEEESNAEDCEEAMDVDCVDDSFTEGQDAQDSTQEENAEKSTTSPKDQTKSSPAVEESDNEEERSSNADASLTEGGNLLSSSQLSEDMTQQEENLFAKLELIQELAEEFCKESEAEKIEDNEEDAINTIDPSDDESLPEVSFGLPSSSPDVKITKTVDDEEDGTERMNDFSDISDADSTDNTKEVKKDAGTSDGSQSRERKEGKSASLHKTDASKEKGNVASDKDLDDSEDVDLSSSDLILSSGVDDEEARRVKRKRKLKRKKNGTTTNGKQDASDNSDEEPDSKTSTKRRVKTTPKKESQLRKSARDSDDDEEDSDSVSKEQSKSKKQNAKSKKNSTEEEEEAEPKEAAGKKSKSALKKQKESQSNGKKKSKDKADEPMNSSEEDERLEKEVNNLLKGPGKRRTRKKEEDEDEEDNDEDGAGDATTKKKEKGDQKAKKGRRKKGDDDSSESSDEDKEDEGEEDEEMDDSADELSSKVSKSAKDSKVKDGDDAENEEAKAAMMDELEDDDDEDEDDDKGDSSSESDIDVTKKRTRKQAADKKKGDSKDNSEKNSESDFEPSEARKRFRSKLLDAKISDSDSDIQVKKTRKGKKRRRDSDEDSFVGDQSNEDDDDDDDGESAVDSDEENSEEDSLSDGSFSGKKKGKGKGKGKKGKGKDTGKKRKRIKKMDSSEGEVEEGEPEDGEEPGSRKKIRKIKSEKKLTDTTKAAAKAEEERRNRVIAKQKRFNGVETKDAGDGQAPVTTKLILEYDEEKEKPLIQVNPKLICKLKPHQVEAVRFMWECLFESLERSKKEEKSAGCILAHCMGLGKTLSVVSFVHTMMSHKKLTKVNTCLVVCPLNTVLNWQNEFEIWLAEKDQLTVYEMASVKQNNARADVLNEWHRDGGIMIIGYEMLRNLSQGSRVRNKKQKAIFNKTLIDPGPDIVVCDEGHIMKNSASGMSKAMMQIKTRRRVVLTGTPLQNNLIEYHCMVDFVKPSLLGTKKEFANRFVNPIINGQHRDSTHRDVRVMKNRAHVLHELLAGCVQRRDYSALTKFLPPKQEYVISVRLSEVQMKLYEEYLRRSGQVEGQITTRGAQLFKDYQNLMKIWTHPWVLKMAEIRDELKMKYDDEDSFIDDEYSDEEKSFGSDSSSSSSSEEEKPVKEKSENEESAGEGTSSGRRSRRLRNKDRRGSGDKDEVVKEWKTRSRGGEGDDLLMEMDQGVQPVSSDWWAEYVTEEDKDKLELGGKLVLLFDILRMCEEIGDKVLIFSQSLLSLNIIEYFLEQIDSKFIQETQDKPEEELKEQFGKRWTKGEDYFRLDGSTSAQMRQHWAGVFNDPENHRCRLFLISTRAGGLGINLVGANRVIIFDASWNPSHDIQSIFRVYRFGQTKPCYIYRFLAQGTMEEKIYDRQVNKLSLSQRVVDEHQVERHFTAADLAELYQFKPERLTEVKERETIMLPKDVLLAEIVAGENKDWFVTIREHDSLLENLVEQELTEEEKKAAWDEYENEKKGLRMNVSNMGQGGAGLNNYLSQEFLLQTARNLRMQNPDMPQEVLQMHLQRIIMMQIRQKQEEQRRAKQEEKVVYVYFKAGADGEATSVTVHADAATLRPPAATVHAADGSTGGSGSVCR